MACPEGVRNYPSILACGIVASKNGNNTLSAHKDKDIAEVSRWAGLIRYDFTIYLLDCSFRSICSFCLIDSSQPTESEWAQQLLNFHILWLYIKVWKPTLYALLSVSGRRVHSTRRLTVPSADFHRLVTIQGLECYFYWADRLVTRQDCNGLAYWVTALPLQNSKRTLAASAHTGSSQPLWDKSRNLYNLYLSNFDGSHIIAYDGTCREMYACLRSLNFISELFVSFSL